MRYLIPILLLIGNSSSIAQDEIRLLPASYTEKLSIEWKQDGRVVDLKLKNPGPKWVVEEITVETTYPVIVYKENEHKKLKDIPDASAKSGKNSLKDIDWKTGPISFQRSPTDARVVISVQPGQAVEAHIELASDAVFEKMLIKESRGREQRMLEKLTNRIFSK